MSKGQASYPFTMVEAIFTFILLMSVAYGAQEYTADYLKEETADLRADRIQNAAVILQTYESGEIELGVHDYEVEIEGQDLILIFDDAREERDLGEAGFDNINGPSDPEEFSSVCLEKNFENELTISEGC